MIPEQAYFKELPLSFILSFKYNILLKNSGTNRVGYILNFLGRGYPKHMKNLKNTKTQKQN